MRIAFVTDEVLPNHGADTFQFVHALSALARQAVTVDLIAPGGAVKDVEVYREALRSHYGADCGFGISLVRGGRLGGRPGRKVVGGFAGAVRSLTRRHDLIHTRNLAPLLAALAARRPVFFETYRPLTRQFPALRRALVLISKQPTFRGLVVHSEVARRAFVQDGFPEHKVVTLYNGFSPAHFDATRTTGEARAALGWPDGPTALYAGRLGASKGCGLLVEAARLLPEVRFVFAGYPDSAEAQALMSSAAGLSNVAFPGYLPGEAVATACQAADVLLVPPSRRPLEGEGTTVLPIKIFNYLAAGRAIVAGQVEDAQEILRHGENAYLVQPDDAGAAARGIREVLAEPALRAALAAGARATAAGLTWDARAARLVEFYRARA